MKEGEEVGCDDNGWGEEFDGWRVYYRGMSEGIKRNEG